MEEENTTSRKNFIILVQVKSYSKCFLLKMLILITFPTYTFKSNKKMHLKILIFLDRICVKNETVKGLNGWNQRFQFLEGFPLFFPLPWATPKAEIICFPCGSKHHLASENVNDIPLIICIVTACIKLSKFKYTERSISVLNIFNKYHRKKYCSVVGSECKILW